MKTIFLVFVLLLCGQALATDTAQVNKDSAAIVQAGTHLKKAINNTIAGAAASIFGSCVMLLAPLTDDQYYDPSTKTYIQNRTNRVFVYLIGGALYAVGAGVSLKAIIDFNNAANALLKRKY